MGQFAEVVTGLEQQRLDAPLSRLLREIEALGLPAAGGGIDDQHPFVRALWGARLPARHLLRGVCMAHRVSGDKAEQEEHTDQHGERHLVVVRESGQPDEPKDDQGQAEETQIAAPCEHKPTKNATRNTKPNMRTTLMGSPATRVRVSPMTTTDAISAPTAANCARRCALPVG